MLQIPICQQRTVDKRKMKISSFLSSVNTWLLLEFVDKFLHVSQLVISSSRLEAEINRSLLFGEDSSKCSLCHLTKGLWRIV